MSKPRKAPEGAVPSETAVKARQIARPYNLLYAQGWEELFRDTMTMVTETEDHSTPVMFEVSLLRRHNIRTAWTRIMKENLIPPRDLFKAERWKGE